MSLPMFEFFFFIFVLRVLWSTGLRSPYFYGGHDLRRKAHSVLEIDLFSTDVSSLSAEGLWVPSWAFCHKVIRVLYTWQGFPLMDFHSQWVNKLSLLKTVGFSIQNQICSNELALRFSVASFLDVNNAILRIPVPCLLNEHDDGNVNYFFFHSERLHPHSLSHVSILDLLCF